MALESPMMPADAHSKSFYLSNSSPASPVPYKRFSQESSGQKRSSGSQPSSQRHSDSVQAQPTSPYPQFVDPSPVDSNGTTSTETTEIEDDDTEDVAPVDDIQSPGAEAGSTRASPVSPLSPDSMLGRIDTSLAARTRADSDAPPSVIHAPQGYKPFDSKKSSPTLARQVSVSPTESTSKTIVSPSSPEFPLTKNPSGKTSLNTDVPPVTERVPSTPRAQTRQEFEDEHKHRKTRSVSLEGIPEGLDGEQDVLEDPLASPENSSDVPKPIEDTVPQERLQHIQSLKDFLGQQWTLCVTLSGLSHNHRNRIFMYRGKTDIQFSAWSTCWKLCKHLYESRDEVHDSQVLTTLEMCRDFCKALFEARQKGDEPSDAVLRVTFEMNNHLYNGHDQGLPLGFQSRTLEFYFTMCHRLMKLPTSLPDETDALLRACWHLTELLFALRKNNRELKATDEEYLTLAIDACYDLTDLFREGWSQTTMSRGASRGGQSTFSQSQASYTSQRTYSELSSNSIARTSTSVSRSPSLASTRSFHSSHRHKTQVPPETPTTVFDDTQDGVDLIDEDNPPNILVLGPQSSNSGSTSLQHHKSQSNPNRWSSAASAYSESSQRTSSTATVSGSKINRIRVLLVHVANSEGWVPRSNSFSSTSSSATSPGFNLNSSLQTFVRSMPSNCFGEAAEAKLLLEKYRKMIADWPVLSSKASPPINNGLLIQQESTKVTSAECARAVLWMCRSSQYEWLKSLFKRYMKCAPDDALRDNIQTIEA